MSMKALPVLCCGPGTEALDPAASETLAARFRALSDPTRVAIVNRLASTEECCVCDLNAAFDLSQPTISHHLKVLRDAGLVESSRRGTWAYYRLVPDAVRELRNTLGGVDSAEPPRSAGDGFAVAGAESA
jgi:ArsR family transcriptional regulator, arsenate/arsenite/antimonite-responsive transcriptional repressor